MSGWSAEVERRERRLLLLQYVRSSVIVLVIIYSNRIDRFPTSQPPVDETLANDGAEIFVNTTYDDSIFKHHGCHSGTFRCIRL